LLLALRSKSPGAAAMHSTQPTQAPAPFFKGGKFKRSEFQTPAALTRAPNNAVPIRTIVAPSPIATR
jgi:hypothetical protein